MNNDQKISDDEKELRKLSLESISNDLGIASQLYDRGIISLSTASLGFTFAYIKFTNCSHSGSCLLFFSWFFLILSILSVLLSFIIIQAHCVHRIKFEYWMILKKGKNISEEHWTDCWLALPSILAGLFYVIGIILFTIFVAINVQ